MSRPRTKRPISVTPFEVLDADGNPTGSWEAFITLGKKPNGKPNVVHRRGKSSDEVADKIRAAEDEYARRSKVTPSRSPKVAAFLERWISEGEQTTPPRWAYNTIKDYRLVTREYLVPHLGDHTMRALEASKDLVKDMLAAVEAKHSAHAAAKAYRVLRAALNDAVRDELVDRNVAKLIREPRPAATKSVGGLTLTEAKAIRRVLATHRDRARYELALALGPRQGECLGLMRHRKEAPRLPSDVDLKRRQITIREKLYRRVYEHGCDDPQACGGKPRKHRPGGLHVTRIEPCPGHGARHNRYHRGGCPKPTKPCPSNCTAHAKACPQRRGGLMRAKPKTRAGERTIAIPEPLVESLEEWERSRQRERLEAADLWVETGYYFTTPFGQPVDPRQDYNTWCEILRRAGVDPARLHDARHFAATYLRALGISTGVITEILGWANESMIQVYDDVADEAKQSAAVQMGQLLWAPDPAPETDQATDQPTGRLADVIDLAARRAASR
jgi:hypothetical protein